MLDRRKNVPELIILLDVMMDVLNGVKIWFFNLRSLQVLKHPHSLVDDNYFEQRVSGLPVDSKANEYDAHSKIYGKICGYLAAE